ncbi:uncharacterized protein LOC105434265 isoform X3 [Pogonomyrmex barbatus]|uniref:Uncharacterized protein LOC105434265 isoform X3 n=1 Tax=Pogonomyrmex barbatus TaxID=144034 RepID=A0A8N1SAY7_9HYME|nr:uncharacterized protein LOC105434265 isoform X3 [Pogonomyrmex barbatus]
MNVETYIPADSCATQTHGLLTAIIIITLLHMTKLMIGMKELLVGLLKCNLKKETMDTRTFNLYRDRIEYYESRNYGRHLDENLQVQYTKGDNGYVQMI